MPWFMDRGSDFVDERGRRRDPAADLDVRRVWRVVSLAFVSAREPVGLGASGIVLTGRAVADRSHRDRAARPMRLSA